MYRCTVLAWRDPVTPCDLFTGYIAFLILNNVVLSSAEAFNFKAKIKLSVVVRFICRPASFLLRRDYFNRNKYLTWLKILTDKPFSIISIQNRYFYLGRVAFSSARLKTGTFPLRLFVIFIIYCIWLPCFHFFMYYFLFFVYICQSNLLYNESA